MAEIAEQVAAKHRLTVSDLKAKSRKARINAARQHAMALMSANRSTTQIGQFLGVHHTTVIHGIKKHKSRIAAQRIALAAPGVQVGNTVSRRSIATVDGVPLCVGVIELRLLYVLAMNRGTALHTGIVRMAACLPHHAGAPIVYLNRLKAALADAGSTVEIIYGEGHLTCL